MRQDEGKIRRAGENSASELRLQEIARQIGSEKLPPVHDWHPEHCGSIDIRIAADGEWHHEGAKIRRPELVRLFSRILRRDDDGFVLVTPAEKLSIQVDDAPFLAVEMIRDGGGRDQRLAFRTNVGDHVIADADHPITMRERPGHDGVAAPYVEIRSGLEALIARPVYYEMAELAEEKDDGGGLGVWSRGSFFALENRASD